MEHIAIMKKSWNLLPKILTGEKKIESRWYKNKYPPWNKIKEGELIYFKDSGCPVTLKSEVEKVLQFSDLNENKVKEILDKHGREDGLGIDDIPKFFEMFKDKKYCMLIYLKNVEKIHPFNINKKGFGMMSAWLSLGNVGEIKCT
ncbi:MAG: ASCH domain-containing protein [Nanoarchaeota archaeon]